jgi:hypothetical protein
MPVSRAAIICFCLTLTASIAPVVSANADTEPVSGYGLVLDGEEQALFFEEAVRAYDAGDYERALRIWQRLAKAGNLAAMRNLGHLYRRGLGVTPDLAMAARWYEEAAAKGFAPAMINLAALYREGDGVERDPRRAIELLFAASAAGAPLAQYELARMTEDGVGTEADTDKAVRLYRRAAARGHLPAIRRLQELGAYRPAEETDVAATSEAVTLAPTVPDAEPETAPDNGRDTSPRGTASVDGAEIMRGLSLDDLLTGTEPL